MVVPPHPPTPVGEWPAGSLAIGCYLAACRNRVGDLLLALSRADPTVDLGIRVMPLRELASALRLGSVSLAIAPNGWAKGFASVPLWDDRAECSDDTPDRGTGAAAEWQEPAPPARRHHGDITRETVRIGAYWDADRPHPRLATITGELLRRSLSK